MSHIPAEEVLGREMDDGLPHDASSSLKVADSPYDRELISEEKATAADRHEQVWLSVLLVIVVAAGSSYYFRGDIQTYYERKIHPERYWMDAVAARWFHVENSELLHQECLIDIKADRMKEPLRARRYRLMDIEEGNAETLAAEVTTNREGLCKAHRGSLDRDKVRLLEVEQQLARVRTK